MKNICRLSRYFFVQIFRLLTYERLAFDMHLASISGLNVITMRACHCTIRSGYLKWVFDGMEMSAIGQRLQVSFVGFLSAGSADLCKPGMHQPVDQWQDVQVLKDY